MSLLDEQSRGKLHLAELDAFLESLVFKGWETARLTRLTETRDDIIDLVPVDRKSEIESYKLRGRLELMEELATFFQDSRETLKQRLDEIEELLTTKHEETTKPND